MPLLIHAISQELLNASIFILDVVEIHAGVHRSIQLATCFSEPFHFINVKNGLERGWSMPAYIGELSCSLIHGLGHQSLMREAYI